MPVLMEKREAGRGLVKVDGQGAVDGVTGGKDGAVRFVYCTTINWIGTKHNAAVQALVQFAELKNGRIRDISRHCIFKTPIDR